MMQVPLPFTKKYSTKKDKSLLLEEWSIASCQSVGHELFTLSLSHFSAVLVVATQLPLHNAKMRLYLWFSQKVQLLVHTYDYNLDFFSLRAALSHSQFLLELLSLWELVLFCVLIWTSQQCLASAMRLSLIFSGVSVKILQSSSPKTAWWCRQESAHQTTILLLRESSRSEHIQSIWTCTTKPRCTMSLTTMVCWTSPSSQESKSDAVLIHPTCNGANSRAEEK